MRGLLLSLLAAILPLPTALAGLFFGSTVCSECKCMETNPYIIDCRKLNLETVFTSSDTWPNNQSNIHLLYGDNALMTVSQSPALDITELSFQKNSIESIADGAFQELKSLRRLDLSHNGLSRDSIGEHTFRGQFSPDDYQPSPIEYLDLSYNDIHSLFEESLSHLSNLRELDLSNNPIKLIDHHTFLAVTSLAELRHLRMRSTGLVELPRSFLHSLRRLESLDLAHNKIRAVPSELRFSHAIRSLCMDGNPMKAVGEDDLRGMTELETLNLSNMPLLESVGDDAFSTLTSLRILRMRNNLRLHIISPYIFRGMDTSPGLFPLKEMFISGNNLTTLSEATVPFWEQLMMLQLHDNPWRCDCQLLWMTTTLLPEMLDTDRREAGQVLCRSPPQLRGVPVLRAADRPGGMNCEATPAPPYQPHSGGGFATLVVVVTAGVLVILTGAGVVTYLVLRRERIKNMYSPRLWAASLAGTLLILLVSLLFFWFVASAATAQPAHQTFLLQLVGSFLLFLLICGVAAIFSIRRQTAAAAYRAKQQIRYRRAAMEEEATIDDVNPAVVIRS